MKACGAQAGEDFKRNLEIADLDFATIHVYPSNWGVPAGTCLAWINNDWIGDRAALAAAAGKPLVLEVSRRIQTTGKVPHAHCTDVHSWHGMDAALGFADACVLDGLCISVFKLLPQSLLVCAQLPPKLRSLTGVQEFGMPRGYYPSRDILFSRWEPFWQEPFVLGVCLLMVPCTKQDRHLKLLCLMLQ